MLIQDLNYLEEATTTEVTGSGYYDKNYCYKQQNYKDYKDYCYKQQNYKDYKDYDKKYYDNSKYYDNNKYYDNSKYSYGYKCS